MRIQLVANQIVVQHVKFTQTLREMLETAARIGIRAFIRAAFPAVPVWTGQARGLYKQLAQAVVYGKAIRVSVPISPVKFLPERGPDTGAVRITQINEPHHYGVIFETNLFYFINNEFFNMQAAGFTNLKHKTPWNSFERGKAAFNIAAKAYIEKNKPQFKDFIEITTITVG